MHPMAKDVFLVLKSLNSIFNQFNQLYRAVKSTVLDKASLKPNNPSSFYKNFKK